MEVYRLAESCVEVLVAILTEYHSQPRNVILPAGMVFIHLPATPAEDTSPQGGCDHEGPAIERYRPSKGDSASARASRMRWIS
jgi:hypothetical protein